MLFWTLLLKDAFPAGRAQRSPPSIRQQVWPKNGAAGAGGPSRLSSSVLNPFIPDPPSLTPSCPTPPSHPRGLHTGRVLSRDCPAHSP
ncbi:hypothetical protein FKM82_030468 [Ascaphus truei]